MEHKLNLHLFDDAAEVGEVVDASSTADAPSEDTSYMDDPAWQKYEQIHQARFAARSAALARSCAQTAQIYPAFNLQQEMQNPRFVRLIDAGLSVRESYEVLHRDQLLRQAVEQVAERTRQEVYNQLSMRKRRTEENGASPALVTRRDPAAMSRSEREKIAKRVMRGEKVTF